MNEFLTMRRIQGSHSIIVPIIVEENFHLWYQIFVERIAVVESLKQGDPFEEIFLTILSVKFLEVSHHIHQLVDNYRESGDSWEKDNAPNYTFLGGLGAKVSKANGWKGG